MPVLLRILDGPQAGSSCEVHVGQRVILGRGDEADFHVLDSWVSRLHCALSVAPEGILLEDLRSKNGTYVAGERVKRRTLPEGSMIQMGTTTLEVLARPTAAEVAAAAPAGVGLRHVGWLAVAAVLVAGLVFGGFRFFDSRWWSSARRAGASGTPGRGRAGGTPRPELRAEGGTAVTFTSEPSGAMVFLDDEFRDVTPLRDYPVSPGEHALRIQKAGYVVHRGTLAVGRRSAEPVHVVLRLAAQGALDIRSTPDGATVYLDGEVRGKTPLRIDHLEPQAYTVRLLKQDFVDWQQEVTVKANETAAVEARLGHREIGYYLARLKADPHNVSYYSELAHLYLLEKKLDLCMQNLDKGMEISYYGRDTSRPAPYQRRLVWLIQKIYFQDHFAYGNRAYVERTRDAVDMMLARVAARHPDDNAAILKLARSLHKKIGQPERTAAFLLKLAEARPADADALAAVIARLRKAGQTQRAEALLKKALERTPKDYRLHVFLGRLHLAAKKQGVAGARQKAIQALNTALLQCTDEQAKREIRKLLGKATR